MNHFKNQLAKDLIKEKITSDMSYKRGWPLSIKDTQGMWLHKLILTFYF